ncbi:voltage-gated potassium channel [Aureococcus anophagefferens]|nr:voltage-gated potassium channel [Aureococcus anophagefferens]
MHDELTRSRVAAARSARWGLDGDFTLGRSSSRAAWGAVLAAAVCYEAVATPLELSFLESGAGALALGRRAATAVFAGDILVNLRTGFYAGEREVRDGRAIARRYLRSRWFLLDFVTASVVGAIAVALQGLETEETHQRAKLSEVSRRMAQMHLPRDLRRRVCEYYRHVWHLDRGSLLGDGRGAPAGGAGAAPKGGGFLGTCRPLRNEVKMHLFAEMLRANPLFQSPRVQACAGLVEAVVERLFTTVYLPGDTILRKGETSPWMGFIGTGGRVAVVLPPADETQQPKTLKILHEGDIIGELGLIFSARRSTDVRALVCVRVHVLSRDAFNAIKAQYPAEGDLLETEIANSLVKRGRMSEADVLKLTKKRTKRRCSRGSATAATAAGPRGAASPRPDGDRPDPSAVDVSPELEAEIAEEEKAIEHLVRSNAELEAHLKDAPDRELRAAVGENIVVIARKRAALQLKYDLRAARRRRHRAASAPPPPPAAASTEARAPPDGGVCL